jgi:hypothetical protein
MPALKVSHGSTKVTVSLQQEGQARVVERTGDVVHGLACGQSQVGCPNL